MNLLFKKMISVALIAVVVFLSINTVFSLAHGIEEAGFSIAHEFTTGSPHVEIDGHCPSCPSDNHPVTDHEHFSCDHHTYISIPAQTDYIHPVPIALLHVNVEPFQFIPEVYLDRFIPPQNLT